MPLNTNHHNNEIVIDFDCDRTYGIVATVISRDDLEAQTDRSFKYMVLGTQAVIV